MDSEEQDRNMSRNDALISAWLRQNATPIAHLEAGCGFQDLQSLKRILRAVKIVGLGEATHGTREFFQFKHRLLEFLVVEMGFTGFVLEASFAACQRLNDYVLDGKGDPAATLTELGYIAWDTEEFTALVEWLAAYNRDATLDRKVRFYGADLWRNATGRHAMRAYLARVAPCKVEAVRNTLEVLAREETKWPLGLDEEARTTLKSTLPQLDDLLQDFASNREQYIVAASRGEFEEAQQYARVMQQWATVNADEAAARSPMRSEFMAENLIYLLENDKPDAKYVVWAHNGHIANGPEPSMGRCLRETYGTAYYAFGLEFHEGSFLSRTPLSPTQLGELREITLPPAPVKSWPWHLARTGLGNLIVDLRVAAGSPAAEAALRGPLGVYVGHWVCPEGFEFCVERDVMEAYDGVVFILRTTATRPTANACRTASAGEAL